MKFITLYTVAEDLRTQGPAISVNAALVERIRPRLPEQCVLHFISGDKIMIAHSQLEVEQLFNKA